MTARTRHLAGIVAACAATFWCAACGDGLSLLPDARRPVAVYGDSRSGPDVHREIVRRIRDAQPLAVFHTGDLVFDGTNPEEFEWARSILNDLLTISPFYPAMGNHEDHSPLLFDTFGLPFADTWYSVDLEGLHCLVLDSTSDMSSGSPQFTFAESDLHAAAGSSDAILVFFHHPLFTVAEHDADPNGWIPAVVPLFERAGVVAVFSGHNHCYERFLYNGITYVTTGGGGAPLHHRARTSSSLQAFAMAHHFCLVTPQEDRLAVEAIGADGVLIDAFDIPL